MGLLSTRWEAKYESHNLTVTRNEIGRGFALEWAGFSEMDGKCTISVDGTEIPVKHIR